MTAYDILGRNVSVSREVADTYISNTATNMLQRYFLFSVRYNLRAFKGAGEGAVPAMPQEPGPDWRGRGGER